MKYKVGDKVKIKSREWFDAQDKDEDDNVCIEGKESFVEYMAEYCGQTATVIRVVKNFYVLDIDDGDWCWQDWMFE